MCDRATNELVTLAEVAGFGSITRCACGTISLHLGGVSIRMEHPTFLQAAGMCEEAVQTLTHQVEKPFRVDSTTLH